MITLGSTFSNEESIVKIHRFLNCRWKPKVTIICQFRDLTTMDTHIIFGKLHKHAMTLKILAIEEEGEKNNKSLTLKVGDFNFDGDMSLMVQNL